jgi:hypothetical protein
LADETLLLQWHGKEPLHCLAKRFNPPRTADSIKSKVRDLGLSRPNPKKAKKIGNSCWVDAEHRAWMIKYQQQPEQRRLRRAQQEAVNL